MSKGTPCSTQLIFCETQKEKLEAEIERQQAVIAELVEGLKQFLDAVPGDAIGKDATRALIAKHEVKP